MVFLGFGNNLTTHGNRSSSPHSTAFLRNVLSTVSTLLTVLGALQLRPRASDAARDGAMEAGVTNHVWTVEEIVELLG